jgi:hypothetical protein
MLEEQNRPSSNINRRLAGLMAGTWRFWARKKTQVWAGARMIKIKWLTGGFHHIHD